MSIAGIRSALQAIGKPKLIVIGEAILDEYVWGEVERISPEAPIPVLRFSRREERVGGAGSVVMNLNKLGAEVRFLSAVGEDSGGRRVLDILLQSGCDISGMAVRADLKTIVKTRHLGFVQHSDRAVQQLLRVDHEDLRPFGEEAGRALLDIFRREIPSASAVLISDYRKGLLTPELLRALIEEAGEKPILIDPALVDDYSIYRGARLICPNRYETSRASGLPCKTVEESARAAERLVEMHGFREVVVTLDRDGIFLQCADGSGQHFPTPARVVSDVAGAGDMVLSILGLVLGGGGTMENAVRLANVAAGIEIRRLGVVPLSRGEILADLHFQGHPGVGKLKSAEELTSLVRDLRSRGKTVVFTNGCFDLLHFGHHHLLNQARRHGDCLVVAVNSDSSIRKIKGPGRPINNEEERMLMLCGLEAVDYVVLFNEDTPLKLLDLLRPDVLVKGGEYRDGVVVGREFVESYGGKVELVEQVEGISTTAILQLKEGQKKGAD